MKSVSPARESSRRDGDDVGARRRAAVETYARNEAALRRTARRHSLCEDDAEDALQRGLEILLRKAPSGGPRELIRWTQTVVKHEAMAIRRERERILPPAAGEESAGDWVELLPSGADGPEEQVERGEAIARSREALRALKPQELRALTLLAQGYSYVEIGEITSWSQTKINRCLAEGRERFRSLISSSEDGRRCAEMRPLISAFCDGEAGAEEAAALREHLRACAHCRATVRTYRAVPATAAAFGPALPLHRSLFERAHEALSDLAARLGGKAEAVTQVASGGGASGAGAVTLVKVAAVCIGTAGGAAACVAGGLVPPPLDLASEHSHPPRLERQAQAPESAPAEGDDEPVATAEPKPQPHSAPAQQQPDPEPAPAPAEPAPEAGESAVPSGAVEYAPPPESAPEPVAASAPESGGDPAGEFGP